MTSRDTGPRLLAVALAGVVADVGLTRVMVGTNMATEAGPISGAAIETVGFAAWAALFLAVVRGSFYLADYLEADGNPRSALGIRVVVVAAPWAVTAANLAGVVRFGAWPDSFPVMGVGALVAGIACFAVVAYSPATVFSTMRGLPIPGRRTVGITAILTLVVLSPIAPFLGFGTLSPVDSSVAANTAYFDFEDGISDWSGTVYAETTDPISGTTSAKLNGSYNDAYGQFPTSSPSEVSFEFRTTGYYFNWYLDSSDGTIANPAIELYSEGDTIEFLDSGGTAHVIANLTNGTEYKVELTNIDWTADTFDASVYYAANDSLVDSYNGANFSDETVTEVGEVQFANGDGNVVIFDNVVIGGTDVPSDHTISGTVTDSNGTAVTNATVQIGAGSTIYTTTNASGYYSLTYNTAGEYVSVESAKSGYNLNETTVYVDSDTTQNLTLSTISGEVSTGTVYTGYQQPAPGAKVRVLDPRSKEELDVTIADATGHYSTNVTGDVIVQAKRADTMEDRKEVSLPDNPIPALYLTEDVPAREGYDRNVTDPVTGGDLDELNISSIPEECDAYFSDSKYKATLANSLTLGITGGLDYMGILEFGPESCQPSTQEQERLALLVASAVQNQSEQNAEAFLSNYLTDARQVAISEGKIAAWNAIADGAVEEQATYEANQSVDGYYHSMYDNLASVYSTSALQAEYVYEREYNQTSSTGSWVYPVLADGTEANFAANPWETATVSLPQGDVEIQTYRLSTGELVTPYPNRTTAPGGGPYIQGPSLRVVGPNSSSDTLSGGAYTHIADSGTFYQLNSEVDSQRQQVKDNLAVMVNETLANYNRSEMNVTDFLDPSEIAGRAATDYNSTGYYSFAAVQLAAQGFAGDINTSHTLELADGSKVNGTLFYTGYDVQNLTNGSTYDPADYNGSFIIAAQGDDGGIRELTAPFTITRQINTQTGEPVNETTIEPYVYDTTDTTSLESDLDRMADLAAAYEQAQSSASIGWPDGSGGSGLSAGAIAMIGLAVVAVVALFGRN